MKKIYHLSTCDTCKRIIKDLNPGQDVFLQDIKKENIDSDTLDWLKSKVGSYEALFSKRAMKFRELGLHNRSLSESDYRELLLNEYTFLKRPYVIHNDNIFIGNAKKVVEEAKNTFHP